MTDSTPLNVFLRKQSNRCDHGYHLATQVCVACTPVAPVIGMAEWPFFSQVVRTVALPDGTVHQRDVRPLVRNRIASKHIGPLYRRACSKQERLLIDTGEREPSNDTVGRNTDKLDRIYRLGPAA